MNRPLQHGAVVARHVERRRVETAERHRRRRRNRVALLVRLREYVDKEKVLTRRAQHCGRLTARLRRASERQQSADVTRIHDVLRRAVGVCVHSAAAARC